MLLKKGKYFHCDVEGRWTRNWKYLDQLKQQKEQQQDKLDLLIIKNYLVENNTSSWIIDSGACNYACHSLQLSESYKDLEN